MLRIDRIVSISVWSVRVCPLFVVVVATTGGRFQPISILMTCLRD